MSVLTAPLRDALARRVVACALALAANGTIFAQQPIPLKQGTYAEMSSTCADAPLAALKMWDGHGFGGAHSSHCVVRIVRAAGQSFHIRNTCSALGDGTPTAPDAERATVTLHGDQAFRYTVTTPSGPSAAEYRWCSVH